MSENYHEIEGRIILACQMLDASEKPNVAAAAREFEVPEIRLRSRWKERLTNLKTTWLASNRKLTLEEEHAVYLYLKRLDETGISVQPQMVTDCVNSILR